MLIVVTVFVALGVVERMSETSMFGESLLNVTTAEPCKLFCSTCVVLERAKVSLASVMVEVPTAAILPGTTVPKKLDCAGGFGGAEKRVPA